MNTISPLTNGNPGIVPPWLTGPEPRNPGIVPPWMRDEVHILPIEDTFTILPVDIDGDTRFVQQPVEVSPISLADALRGR